jgi:hypothetical protein
MTTRPRNILALCLAAMPLVMAWAGAQTSAVTRITGEDHDMICAMFRDDGPLKTGTGFDARHELPYPPFDVQLTDPELEGLRRDCGVSGDAIDLLKRLGSFPAPKVDPTKPKPLHPEAYELRFSVQSFEDPTGGGKPPRAPSKKAHPEAGETLFWSGSPLSTNQTIVSKTHKDGVELTHLQFHESSPVAPPEGSPPNAGYSVHISLPNLDAPGVYWVEPNQETGAQFRVVPTALGSQRFVTRPEERERRHRDRFGENIARVTITAVTPTSITGSFAARATYMEIDPYLEPGVKPKSYSGFFQGEFKAQKLTETLAKDRAAKFVPRGRLPPPPR